MNGFMSADKGWLGNWLRWIMAMRTKMGTYRYLECGLDNVFIEGMSARFDDDDEEVVSIPNLPGLHRAIALGICRKKTRMSGLDLRFLRTEMNKTQVELAFFVHREPLAISRWERGEIDIDNNAEVLIRVLASEVLKLPTKATIQEIAGWCIATADSTPLVIDGSNPRNYRLQAA
jgi:DNA-binding transcriptional regulator YiaG